MSKMDELRKMREARYEAAAARAKKPAAPGKAAGKTAGKRAATSAAQTPEESPAEDAALCGHRNMSGRTCTREHGHAAKSHRYS